MAETRVRTLGDYRDICAALAGPDCKAVAFLDRKIAEQGRDQKVVAHESQMLLLLGSMMLE